MDRLTELRTPLAVVAGALELARDEADAAGLRRLVEMADRNAQALTAAIAAIDAELRAGR